MLTICSRNRVLYICNNSRKYASQSSNKSKIQEVKKNVSKEIKTYALNRYVNYIKNYDKVLESKFPRAMHVYRVFAVGIQDFYREMKEFVSIRRGGGAVQTLERKQLDIFYRMPREMKKVAPVLLISALPLANYIVFPLAYIFPKHLLSSHFWSLEQRFSFALQDHTNNLQYYRPNFRSMQQRISAVEDKNLQAAMNMNMILSKLASGVHPTVKEILEVRILFQREPFHLNCIHVQHKKNLLRIHGMHTLWSRNRRLEERAQEIYNKDRAIERDGVASLTLDELKWACFARGLNPSNMRSDDMLEWLDQWIAVTSHVDSSTMSLLLHCPVLLAYNNPTNRVLMQ